MAVVQKPMSVNVAFLACSTFQAVIHAINEARAHLGEILSAMEFLDAEGMECVRSHVKLRSPLETDANFYVLIETRGSHSGHDGEKLQVQQKTLHRPAMLTIVSNSSERLILS